MRFNPRSRLAASLFDFLLIFAGFAVAIFPYDELLVGGLGLGEMLSNSFVSAVIFWVVIQFHDGGSDGLMVAFLERFCLGAGANLLLHSLLTYAFLVRRAPFLMIVGSLLASALLTFHRQRVSGRVKRASRVLLIGCDAIAVRIVEAMRPVLGVIERDGVALPAGVPFLGNLSACGEILREQRPTHVVIGMDDWNTKISPSLLLQWKLAGTVVEDSPSVYERLFHRISCVRLQPMDLLLSSALRGDSRTMAIQAVYTNLVGLFFLVALSPLLLALSIAVAVTSGPGPTFESMDCAGFRYIPFRLLRFRTCRLEGSHEMTGIGRLLTRLRLVNLPQLINVVRGEMALVGPRPVRREFAYALTELMPFYSHRVSVKPGMFGWAQMHTRMMHAAGQSVDDCLQVEYDLYYIKRGSPWLDGQILIAALFPQRAKAGRIAEPDAVSTGAC